MKRFSFSPSSFSSWVITKKMFGRLRPPPSSPDSLELERSHSKLFKDDCLSVYEATLMKLKQGSQLATTYSCHPPIEDKMESETDCISSTILHNSHNSTQASSIGPSATDLKHQPSVLDLFSCYKLSQQQSICSKTDITMATPDDISRGQSQV
ncbi:hypothetical protein LINPERPRIM_LOCUS12951 [Linum perenne]